MILLLLLLSHFSCVPLCVTPETAAHQAGVIQGVLSHRIQVVSRNYKVKGNRFFLRESGRNQPCQDLDVDSKMDFRCFAPRAIRNISSVIKFISNTEQIFSVHFAALTGWDTLWWDRPEHSWDTQSRWIIYLLERVLSSFSCFQCLLFWSPAYLENIYFNSIILSAILLVTS